MTAQPLVQRMGATLHDALVRVRENLGELSPRATATRVGRVVRAGDGVATVIGLSDAVAGELMWVDGLLAQAVDLAAGQIRVVMLQPGDRVVAGAPVRPVGRVAEIRVGPGLIGRVLDPLGTPLDGLPSLHEGHRVPIDGHPLELIDREPVSRPLSTGLFTLDTMIPIGRGQRQLVVGDRSTGKTELCLDILAGLPPDTIGVYVAIGRRASDSAAALAWLREQGVLQRGFAVVTSADDPPGLIHLAPYAACAMAEGLMHTGKDVVIVYDDLTYHAHVHRTLALLLGRPVGREAHPVDIFYAHARLLERATQLSEDRGGGSLTAFPIVETQSGDLTGYIPTNLVSITDGQIRLDAALVAAGQLPAIDVGLSVSRVGGKAQPKRLRLVTGQFKNRYAQFLELETFARFGTRLEAHAQAVVDWGRRVRTVLCQDRGRPRRSEQTVALVLLCQTQAFLRVQEVEIPGFMDRACRALVEALEGLPADAPYEELHGVASEVADGCALRQDDL